MDFTLFSTENLYNLYEVGLVNEKDLVELYAELIQRREKENSIFNEIEWKVSKLVKDVSLEDLLYENEVQQQRHGLHETQGNVDSRTPELNNAIEPMECDHNDLDELPTYRMTIKNTKEEDFVDIYLQGSESNCPLYVSFKKKYQHNVNIIIRDHIEFCVDGNLIITLNNGAQH